MKSSIRHSAAAAALLSLVWPGLGHALRGDRRRALLFALPPLVLLGIVIALVLYNGPVVFAAHLIDPRNAIAAGLAVLALAAWWAAGIVDSAHPSTPASIVVAALALALVMLGAGWSGSVLLSIYRAGETIRQPIAGGSPSPSPVATASPGPGSTPRPSASPIHTPEPGGRITVLFLGRDLGRGSEGHLTDTMQVASFDPRSGSIVMISLPRDTGQLPLYTGGVWNQKINALMSYAEEHPDQFPDGGIGTLMRQLEYIIGIPIDYYASVDFAGFEQLIDMVGGVDVVLERPIADPSYYWGTWRVGFYLEPGEHHLDGKTALAYARSRHGAGNSDFRRARRQQEVLLALRHKINDPAVVANLPAIIEAAAQAVRTNAPLDRLPQIISLLQQSTGATAESYVLQPRRFAEVIPREEIGRVYMTRLKMDAVAELSISLFGQDSRYAVAPD